MICLGSVIWTVSTGSSSSLGLVYTTQLEYECRHDSNVAQLPDGQTLVANRESFYHLSLLKLKIEPKSEKKEPKPHLTLDAGSRHYLDDTFSNRNSDNIGLNWSIPFQPPRKSPLLQWSVKLSSRFNFLNALDDRDLAFQSSNAAATAIFKPKKIETSWADAVIPVLGINVEQRDFKKGYALDASTFSKDTWTPGLTSVLIGLKKHKSFKSRGMALLLLRQGFSKSPDQKALHLRFGLSWSAIFSKTSLGPDIAFSLRDQSQTSSNLGPRQDERIELGLRADHRFSKDRWQLKGACRVERQRSNLNDYNYSNFSTGVSLALHL
jgi:hypothetical protein